MADYKSIYTGQDIDNKLSQVSGKQDKITNEKKLSSSLVSGLSRVAITGNFGDLLNTPDFVEQSNYDIEQIEVNNRIHTLETRPILFVGDEQPTPIPGNTIVWIKPKS